LTEETRDDDDDTASEDESDEGSEEREEGDESESDEDTEFAVKATKKFKVDALKPGKQIADLDMASSDDEDEDEDDEDEDLSEEKVVDFSREKELANRVFERVVASSKVQELDEALSDDVAEIEVKKVAPKKVSAKDTKVPVKETKTSETKASVKEVKKPELAESSKKTKKSEPVAETSQEDSLNRTVFVRNLPLEAKVQDLRRQFSEFGEVKSFRLVLHPITK